MSRVGSVKRFSKMLVFLVMVCLVGTSVGVEDHKNEIESLRVPEGGNLTISIPIKTSDEEPQVLVSRLNGSSEEVIAQIICHNQKCEPENWESGFSLRYDGENVTLILMNVCYNQTGLYKVDKLSDTQSRNTIYNVTVHPPPLSTISPEPPPSAMYFAALAFTGVIIIIIIAVIYWRRRKKTFNKVPEDDDTTVSSRCESLCDL